MSITSLKFMKKNNTIFFGSLLAGTTLAVRSRCFFDALRLTFDLVLIWDPAFCVVRSFVMLCISFFLYSVIFPRDYRWNAHWGNASGFFLRLDYEIGAAGSGIGLPRVLLGVAIWLLLVPMGL